MQNNWELKEANIEIENGKYLVIIDPSDPRNKSKKNDKTAIVCVICKTDGVDDRDLQNAAMLKESKNMLTTLLELKKTLSTGKRGGFSTILANNTINKINTTLSKIYKL